MDDGAILRDSAESNATEQIRRGDEHPSGLRDAIRETLFDVWVNDTDDLTTISVDALTDAVLEAVGSALAVVSEREIEAAARVIYDKLQEEPPYPVRFDLEIAQAALAASRGVLIDRSSSGE